jgi:hypothetical protein
MKGSTLFTGATTATTNGGSREHKTSPSSSSSLAYVLKHTLIGFQYLLKLSLVEGKELSLPIANLNDWISAFAESFLLLLPSSNTFFMNERMLEDGFDKLLPFLIELWFHLSIGSEIISEHDWLFWELTKVIIIILTSYLLIIIYIIFNIYSV